MRKLGIFERKILRCILGGIQVNGSWRRSNLELYKIYKQPDVVKFVTLQRLKWAGNLAKMNEDCCCKKIFLVKNWKKVAKSWDAWKRLLEKARVVEPLKKKIVGIQ
ncbi:uncharacterized transposon-derived protein F52C9.6 [Trichonephila clavipes]|nr:uncharacterized transposon-derived protein F52C9.6 [Trichonephila clavipes]